MKIVHGAIVILLVVLGEGGCGPVAEDYGHVFLAPTPASRLKSGPPSSTSSAVSSAVARRTPSTSRAAPRSAGARVFLDPGHGGVDAGSLGTTENGTVVEEKTIALAIAQRAAARQSSDGIAVMLSRTDDTLLGSVHADHTPADQSLMLHRVFTDLQRPIDRAKGE